MLKGWYKKVRYCKRTKKKEHCQKFYRDRKIGRFCEYYDFVDGKCLLE